MLINLDQSKAFDRVDHRFLVTVLETPGFKPEFCKLIRMLHHSPQAVVQVNRKRSEVFAIELLVRQSCPSSSLLNVLAFESLFRRLRDEKANPALHEVLFTHPHCWGVVWARPSAGAKLIRGMGQGRNAGGYMASKAIILKGQGFARSGVTSESGRSASVPSS